MHILHNMHKLHTYTSHPVFVIIIRVCSTHPDSNKKKEECGSHIFTF